ncbi:thiamine pyrophosphate-binding protein [Siccirubricoccus sp. KC 17139]|uniref:Thiamine pyrophosphate-binding protein n=1 Tax=Siccirubricoccus soli TaxID=2899147 RepID=A0ABT1D5Z7_9PROT|nr:thiamine pyrophosphate-binding protein [Siccirubricoccus soli]MCO6417358.1 thiamine pyrophosphate-binding protein [Siccirubricoccus soli]MCP2683493.1 thiamine pyrophosphate-binding protein [Siccirubricoccus soli]
MNGAEWLARSLKESGQTHLFFVDAVLRRTLLELERVGVQPVLAHTEKAAVYMADAYGRVSGRPGVVAAQSVGAANLAAGLQDAYLARSPVLALTGHKPIGHQHRNAYQEVAHAPLFAPVTKFAAMVQEGADLPRQFRQAWAAAVSVPPRPVHLDLNGLMGEFVERGEAGAPPAALGSWRAPSHRPVAAPEEVRAAAAGLRSAQKVVIVAGDGAALSGCGAELLALAEVLQAPIATSLGARGIIPTTHPLAVGVVGNYSAPPANQVVHAAELVLFIGCDTGDQVTHTWRVPKPGTRVVQLDADPLEFHRSYDAEVTLLGDPRATLAALVAELGTPTRSPDFLRWAQGVMAEWRRAMAPRLTSEAVAIDPARLCAEVTRALPADGILVADTGYSGIWTGTLVELEPTQTYLRAAGSLGWAFPAALGAKCAAPGRKVIAWSGDGALYYHLPELETAKRRGIAVVLVVNNNSGFGQGWPNYLKQAGNRPKAAEQVLRFGPTDFAAVARQFGLKGIRVEKPGEIATALEEALDSEETVVVDVVTEIEARAPEPWTPEEGA